MPWPLPVPVNRGQQEIKKQLNRIERKLDTIMSEQTTTQADVDAATSAITGLETSVSEVAADLETAVTSITAEIAALQQANPSVDTTALDAAVAALSAPLAALQSADTAVDSLETPAPAPVTPPASS